MQATIGYTVPARAGRRCGIVIPTPSSSSKGHPSSTSTQSSSSSSANSAVGRFPLKAETFRGQHGCVPTSADGDGEWENEVRGVEVFIEDASRLGATLETVGFAKVDFTTRTTNMEEYYAAVAEAARAHAGASAAFPYCHVSRRKEHGGVDPNAGGFAGYAHTDHSNESWSARLDELLKGKWVGPSGLSRQAALRASRAPRHAVVSAWRYLGPAPTCRSSHLGLLDHSTLDASDVVPFSVVCGGCLGGNLRLAHNPKHRWYYFPHLTPDELLLFTVSDSKTLFKAGSSSVFHSSFNDPTAEPGEPSRQSIDVRVLLVWDDRQHEAPSTPSTAE